MAPLYYGAKLVLALHVSPAQNEELYADGPCKDAPCNCNNTSPKNGQPHEVHVQANSRPCHLIESGVTPEIRAEWEQTPLTGFICRFLSRQGHGDAELLP
eukprot:6318411-Amphidinium_carterae.1